MAMPHWARSSWRRRRGASCGGCGRFWRDPEGGYGASQDADVGLDDDGDYFTWTLEEARAAIGDEDAFEVAAAYYDIGTAGEMHHDPAKNVLYTRSSRCAAIATRLGIDRGRRSAAQLALAEGRACARPAPRGRPPSSTAPAIPDGTGCWRAP